MTKPILIFLVALLSSCEPMIKNDVDTLDEIFSNSEFNMKIESSGCFGGTEEDFTLERKSEGFVLTSESTKKSHLVPKIEMDSLKDYLKSKIGTKSLGNCTVTTYVRIGTFFNSIDFKHSYCGKSNGVDKFLNYNDLIN
jgi:hypothetical protein